MSFSIIYLKDSENGNWSNTKMEEIFPLCHCLASKIINHLKQRIRLMKNECFLLKFIKSWIKIRSTMLQINEACINDASIQPLIKVVEIKQVDMKTVKYFENFQKPPKETNYLFTLETYSLNCIPYMDLWYLMHISIIQGMKTLVISKQSVETAYKLFELRLQLESELLHLSNLLKMYPSICDSNYSSVVTLNDAECYIQYDLNKRFKNGY